MTLGEVDPLLEWDWRGELASQDRSIAWLTRATNRGRNTVYRYAWGTRNAPLAWLREAHRALGVTPAMTPQTYLTLSVAPETAQPTDQGAHVPGSPT